MEAPTICDGEFAPLTGGGPRREAGDSQRACSYRGRVVGDRYHAHILKTPSEVKRARNYLLTNARHHYGHVARDPYRSIAPVIAPRTWLLRRAPT